MLCKCENKADLWRYSNDKMSGKLSNREVKFRIICKEIYEWNSVLEVVLASTKYFWVVLESKYKYIWFFSNVLESKSKYSKLLYLQVLYLGITLVVTQLIFVNHCSVPHYGYVDWNMSTILPISIYGATPGCKWEEG